MIRKLNGRRSQARVVGLMWIHRPADRLFAFATDFSCGKGESECVGFTISLSQTGVDIMMKLYAQYSSRFRCKYITIHGRLGCER
jgi:hypothetical protein